jgi:hypothetical protein
MLPLPFASPGEGRDSLARWHFIPSAVRLASRPQSRSPPTRDSRARDKLSRCNPKSWRRSGRSRLVQQTSSMPMSADVRISCRGNSFGSICSIAASKTEPSSIVSRREDGSNAGVPGRTRSYLGPRWLTRSIEKHARAYIVPIKCPFAN